MGVLGAYWAVKFRKIQRLASTVSLYKRTNIVYCPGGWINGEYDPDADELYHDDHSTADPCVDGLISYDEEVSSEKVIIARDRMWGSYIEDDDAVKLGLGTLDINEAVILTDSTVDLTGLYKVEHAGLSYGIVIEPRDFYMDDEILFKYARLRKI